VNSGYAHSGRIDSIKIRTGGGLLVSKGKPEILTVLSILAIVIGVYMIIRAGPLGYESIRLWSTDFDSIVELCMGVLSAAFGIFALITGVMVLRAKKGCIAFLSKYSILLIAYQIIWVVFAIGTGKIVGWGTVILDAAVGIGTFILILINEEIRKYPETRGGREG
jgi:hypothetical protein